MTSIADIIPLWSKGINFKAYSIDKNLEYDQIEKTLKQFNGNLKEQKEGWLTDYPYINDGKTISFVYTRFVNDSKASRVVNYNVQVPDSVGCYFYKDKKILIVSTASDSKINGLVRKKMFSAINILAEPKSVEYSTDFLFWLAYKHDIEGMKITNHLKVESVKAISSEFEKTNLSGAVSSNSNVTDHIQAQIMLAIYGFVNGAEVTFNHKDAKYSFKISADGRISAGIPSTVENKEDKAQFALMIHSILQETYKIYEMDKDSVKWEEKKKHYRCNKLDKCSKSIQDFKKQMMNN
ncbi:hypothetical protein [Methanolobus chelungpuianus]|uniref:Uncharacterized protein n=1 Tax=Methanolobus chelungpuianus TaxID=502115 RepID=A0AAE3KYF8_9EURY|nr:hypothetical protein [Methanolobus chelungpuianus]MCQ6962974.1 hypothetical protein [Methanolobus chelungpuianus]